MPKTKFFIPVLLLLFAAYFLTRLQNLTSIPLFADEAIYVRWSQLIKNVETLRFIPMTDGKQPLFMWLTVPFFKVSSDPLVAARLVSVISGSLLMLGIFLTFSLVLYSFSKPKSDPNPLVFAWKSVIFSFPLNRISLILYIILPFTFFFDRLALADTLLSMFGIYTLFFAILQTYYYRFDISLLSGIILGAAWVTKSPAIYFIVLYFITLLSFALINKKSFIPTIYLSGVTVLTAFIIYNFLRLGPQFHMIALRNLDYVWSLSDIIKHPLDPLKPHLGDTLSIYQSYVSLPLIIISLLGLFTFIKYSRAKLNKNYLFVVIIFLWWILPLIATAAIAKVFTARYILFTLPSLITLLSLLLYRLIKAWRYSIIIILFSFISNIVFIYRLSLNPYNVSLPSTESGYLSNWTSGWGIKESAQYLKQRSKQANVIVGSEGYFGTLPDGLQIYTDGTPQLTVVPSGINITEIPSGLINAKNYGDEVYLLFNRSRLKLPPDTLQHVTVIKQFDKPDDDPLFLIKI